MRHIFSNEKMDLQWSDKEVHNTALIILHRLQKLYKICSEQTQGKKRLVYNNFKIGW